MLRRLVIAVMTSISCIQLAIAEGNGVVDDFSYHYTQEPAWSKEASYKDSYYRGAIVAKCRISALNGGGLENLHRFFRKWVEKRADHDHPQHPDKWVSRPGYFDIKKGGKAAKLDAVSRPFISYEKDDEGELKMRMMSYLGYGRNRIFIYYAESQKIFTANGDKARLGEFKGFYRLTKSEKRGYYDVYIWRYYTIGSYWYEPEGMFTNTVRKSLLESFRKDMLEWYHKWARQL